MVEVYPMAIVLDSQRPAHIGVILSGLGATLVLAISSAVAYNKSRMEDREAYGSKGFGLSTIVPILKAHGAKYGKETRAADACYRIKLKLLFIIGSTGSKRDEDDK